MQLVFTYIYRQTLESLIPYFTADEYYLWCVSSPISLKPLLSMAMAFMSLIPTQTRSNSLSFPSSPIFFSSQSLSHRLLPRSINPSSPPSPPSISIRASISPNPPRAATTAFDLQKDVALERSAPSLPFRIGHGFDLHRLEPGYPLIIGGISIPHDRGCEAHSDGDVLLHCVVDAILGALGLPDIGQIFPDTDPKWKGAASSVFMKEAVRLMHEAGYELGNLDATLILQRPKLSPHKESIRANLCELLGADPSVVNLKAKTHEKVDSLGENRSIAAHTVVLLMRK